MLANFNIIKQLVKKDLKVKYKSSVLGYLWSLGTPILLAVIYEIAFSHVMRIKMENYSLFLITGLFAWQWFANSVNTGVWSFIWNTSIIKKVRFPYFLLPLSHVFIDFVHFLLAIPVIIAFLYFNDFISFYWIWLLGIPLIAIIQFLICFSFALIVGSINSLFRDMERIVVLGVTMMMFLTPIFYPVSMVPDEYLIYIQLNPMTYVIESWHQLFMEGTLNAEFIQNSAISASISMFIAILVYRKLSPKFAEAL